jgi:hypothetical protein
MGESRFSETQWQANKADSAADQGEGWLREESEKRLDLWLMLRYVTSDEKFQTAKSLC